MRRVYRYNEMGAIDRRLTIKIVDVGLVVAGASIGALGGRGVLGGIIGGALGAATAYMLYGDDVARVKVEDREMVLDVVQTAKGWLLRLKKLSGRKTWAEGVEVFPTKKGAKEAAQKMIDGVPPSMPVEML
jgi:hypothetical protein